MCCIAHVGFVRAYVCVCVCVRARARVRACACVCVRTCIRGLVELVGGGWVGGCSVSGCTHGHTEEACHLGLGFKGLGCRV